MAKDLTTAKISRRSLQLLRLLAAETGREQNELLDELLEGKWEEMLHGMLVKKTKEKRNHAKV